METFTWLRGIIDTAESSNRRKFFDSAVSMIPRSQTPGTQWYRGVWLHGLIDTAEFDSADSMIPQSQTPRTQWYLRVRLRGLNDTAESNVIWKMKSSADSMIPRSQYDTAESDHHLQKVLQLLFKGITKWKIYLGQYFCSVCKQIL